MSLPTNRSPARAESAPNPAAGEVAAAAPPPAPRRVGLINQGCTCYLNSLLQTLYHLSHFRTAVYQSSDKVTDAEDEALIPHALQALFFQMQERTTPVSTKGLTDAFGWDEREVFVQHDIQELAALLRETLEARMKGTPAEGYINTLFTGYGEKFFRTLDGSYTSRRPDTFYDVHVPVSGFADLKASLRSLVATEQLTGDNKYKVEEEGKPAVYKDAETGYRFLRFPPVIFFHLKRFEMDMTSPTLEMKKVNSALEFPARLDLRDLEAGFSAESPEPDVSRKQTLFSRDSEPEYDLIGVVVHRGGVRSGHYFCYMRDLADGGAAAGADGYSPWIEFDDDYVRFVEESQAVMRNWGGYQTVNIRGIDQNVLSSQNAYMLVYARRADVHQLLRPVSVDATIPAAVLESYRKQLVVDENSAREEEARRKRCTIHLLSDNNIDDFVRFSNGSDLFTFSDGPRSATSMTVEKKMVWSDFIVDAAKVLGEHPTAIRLWLFKAPAMATGQTSYVNLRPSAQLPLINDEGSNNTPVEKILEQAGVKIDGDTKRLISVAMYVERARDHLPAIRTNIASRMDVFVTSREPGEANAADPGKAVGNQLFVFNYDDLQPAYSLTTDDGSAVRVSHVSFRVSKRQHGANYRVEVHQHPKRPSLLWSETQVDPLDDARDLQPKHFHFAVPDGIVGARVVILRESSVRFLWHISRVQVHTTPADFTRVVGEPAEPPARVRELPKCETKNTQDCKCMVMVKYFNHITGTVRFCGSAIINVNELLRNNMREIRAVCRLPADIPVQVYAEWRASDIRPFNELQFANDSAHGLYAIVNGTVLIVQQHPRTIPVCFRYNCVEQLFSQAIHLRNWNVRHVSEPSKILAMIQMNGRWDYTCVTECIGNHLKLNPERIRLFGPKEVGTSACPKPDAIRSDEDMNLDNMTRWNSWPSCELFIDVLDVDRSIFENTVTVKCSYSGSEYGTDATDPFEFALTKQEATAVRVIDEVLRRAGKPFDRPHVLIEMRDHMVTSYYEVGPGGTALSSAQHGPLKPKNKAVSRMFRDSERTYEVRPHTPALGTDEWLLPVCYGEYDARINATCAKPFFTIVTVQDTPNIVFQKLMERNPLAEEDKPKDAAHNLLLYVKTALYFPDAAGTALHTYFTHTQRHFNNVVRHVMINRKRPKEKPGSRYVATNDPQLVIDKRAKRRRGGEGSGAGAAGA